MSGKNIKITKRSVPVKVIGREGNVNNSDLWMHEQVLSELPDKPVSKGLYLDLYKSKNIDKSKLVRRPVQVRGKNGKIFTRMQWVDPKTGLPPGQEHAGAKAEEHNPHTKHIQEHDPHMSKKEHIDAHVKKMSREEKYAHLGKHKVDWKRNDHPAIDHKNAVEALKQHMYKNPHLAGAENLPDHVEKTPTGDSKVQNFMDAYKKHPEKLYAIMKELGVAEVDPRTLEGKQPKDKGGDGTGAIMHMKNMMALKKYLKENLDKIDHYLGHDTNAVQEKPKKDAPAQSKAQQGGNDIKTILARMSPKELYDLMKEQGISEVDPRLDPTKAPVAKGGDGTGAILHMRNMMALKKAIIANPQILNITPDGLDKPEEKERKESLEGDHLVSDKAKDFLNGVSRETKLKWAKDYETHPEMQNRIKSEHEHVDNMHKLSALKKILMQHPELMSKGTLFDEHRKETLLNYKVKNKDLQKVLRKLLNIPVGDVKQVEKGVEWEFGEGSFARIEEDEDGEPVLSLVDTGKMGDEWNEHSILMSKVKEFLESSEGSEPKLMVQETPLHKKPIEEIYKKLDEDYDTHMSPEVAQRVNLEIAHATRETFDGNARATRNKLRGDYVLSEKTFFKHLEDSKALLPKTDRIDLFSHGWNQIALGHLVTKEKTGNANDLLETRYFDNPGFSMFEGHRGIAWVLNESAKHWSPEERAQARRELLHTSVHIGDTDLRGYDKDKVKENLVHAIHHSLEFVPFDLLSETLKSGKTGISIHFTDTYQHATGSKLNMVASHYDQRDKVIRLQGGYVGRLDHNKSMENVNPNRHIITEHRKVMVNGEERQSTYSNLGDVVSHEFAHAVDDFLSGRDGHRALGSGRWSRFAESKKYNAQNYQKIYHDKVNSSNPKHLMGDRNGSYLYHLDEWISSYEGRVYHSGYYSDRTRDDYVNSKTGADKKFGDLPNSMSGLEHWSENTSRYATALMEYKQHKQETGRDISMDDWAKEMYDSFVGAGFGDDSNTKSPDGKALDSYAAQYMDKDGTVYRPTHKFPAETAGYLYHRMKETHPEIHKLVSETYGRGDFVGSSEESLESKYEKGDYTRKSDVSLILNL